MLTQRLISAAIGIPFIIGAIWIGKEALAALVALAVFVAVIEIGAARETAGTPWWVLTAIAAAALPVVALSSTADVLGAAAFVIMIQLTILTFSPDPKASVETWLFGIMSCLYFGVLAAHFVLLREMPEGRDLVIFTVVTVWLTDTGAYAVGRAIGARKLAPAISPGKTVEGALGSIVVGFASVFLLDFALGLDLDLNHRIALGLVLPVVILFGDLGESAIKRAVGVKDSSNIVPGHGGVADRIDSLLFAVPFVYWYINWVIL
jgi:phosphatidate cytidylyltransferase